MRFRPRPPVATYNEGIEWIAGDYTILLSADDLLAPGSLARAAGLLDAHPEVGLAYGRGVLFEFTPPAWAGPVAQSCPWEIFPGPAFLEACSEDGVNPVCTPTAVTRTSLQRRLGGYRPELPHAGDLEMWLRFAAYSHVGVLDGLQAYYRVHANNMSHHWYDATLADLEQRLAAFDVLLREHGSSMADPEGLRSRATRGLAWTAFWGATRAFEAGEAARSVEILEFALGLDPAIRGRREFANLAWKRRAGRRLWSAIRPAVGLLRGRPARS